MSSHWIFKWYFVKFIITNPSQIPTPYSFYVDLNSCYGGNTVFSQNILGGGPSINLSGYSVPYTIDTPADQPILVKQRKSGAYAPPNDTLFVPAGTTRTYIMTY